MNFKIISAERVRPYLRLESALPLALCAAVPLGLAAWILTSCDDIAASQDQPVALEDEIPTGEVVAVSPQAVFFKQFFDVVINYSAITALPFLKFPDILPNIFSVAEAATDVDLYNDMAKMLEAGKITWTLDELRRTDNGVMFAGTLRLIEKVMETLKNRKQTLRILNVQGIDYAQMLRLKNDVIGIVFPRQSLLQNRAGYNGFLVHELHHAHLDIPTVMNIHAPQGSAHLSVVFEAQEASELINWIQHAFFFPEMREMSLTPNSLSYATRDSIFKIDFASFVAITPGNNLGKEFVNLFLNLVTIFVELSAPPPGFSEKDKNVILKRLKKTLTAALGQYSNKKQIVETLVSTTQNLVKTWHDFGNRYKHPTVVQFCGLFKDAWNQINAGIVRAIHLIVPSPELSTDDIIEKIRPIQEGGVPVLEIVVVPPPGSGNC